MVKGKKNENNSRKWNEKKTNDKTVDSANIVITILNINGQAKMSSTLNINGQAKMSLIDTEIY